MMSLWQNKDFEARLKAYDYATTINAYARSSEPDAMASLERVLNKMSIASHEFREHGFCEEESHVAPDTMCRDVIARLILRPLQHVT